jgi:hypothetical protein
MCWLHAVEIAVDLKNLRVKVEISPKWQLHGCQAQPWQVFFWFHPRCCFSCTFSVHWLHFPCCSVSDRDIILHTTSLDRGQISLGRRNHQPQGGWPSLFSLVADPPALNLNSDLLLVLGNWLILLYTICSKTKVSIYVDRIFPSNFFFMYSFFDCNKVSQVYILYMG